MTDDDRRFCPLCTVALDLHDGPNSCHLAAQREFMERLPFALLGMNAR